MAFHFAVGLDGFSHPDAAFAEVSGISMQMETETVVEGGENRFVHQLPKAMKSQRLILRRGIARCSSRLTAWCRKVLEGGLEHEIVCRQLQVALCDSEGNALRTWDIANAWPVSWDVEAFDARKSEIAIEKIELSYAYATRMT